jgi:hypothetical protein
MLHRSGCSEAAVDGGIAEDIAAGVARPSRCLLDRRLRGMLKIVMMEIVNPGQSAPAVPRVMV